MYIAKPEAGCQGRGIFIARSLDELKQRLDGNLKRQQTVLNEQLKQEEASDYLYRHEKNLLQEIEEKHVNRGD
jgi:5-formaminoimidazole-4-carboxamide-1-beta-D-ribofuranosyl 5'-monophosphate synthetase